MERLDDRYEAVLRHVLETCDDSAEAETMPYEDVLRQLQGMSAESLGIQEPEGRERPEPPLPDTDEAKQAVRDAVGRLDPHADDALLADEELLRRLLVVVERELSRWTSSIVQPPGLTGATAVAPTPAAAVEG